MMCDISVLLTVLGSTDQNRLGQKLVAVQCLVPPVLRWWSIADWKKDSDTQRDIVDIHIVDIRLWDEISWAQKEEWDSTDEESNDYELSCPLHGRGWHRSWYTCTRAATVHCVLTSLSDSLPATSAKHTYTAGRIRNIRPTFTLFKPNCAKKGVLYIQNIS